MAVSFKSAFIAILIALTIRESSSVDDFTCPNHTNVFQSHRGSHCYYVSYRDDWFNQKWAKDHCTNLSIGGKEWNLIGFDSRHDEDVFHIAIVSKTTPKYFRIRMWLDLVRNEPTVNETTDVLWRNPSKWFWQTSGKSLSQTYGNIPWADGQPDNAAGRDERCVLATMDSAKRMTWHGFVCGIDSVTPALNESNNDGRVGNTVVCELTANKNNFHSTTSPPDKSTVPPEKSTDRPEKSSVPPRNVGNQPGAAEPENGNVSGWQWYLLGGSILMALICFVLIVIMAIVRKRRQKRNRSASKSRRSSFSIGVKKADDSLSVFGPSNSVSPNEKTLWWVSTNSPKRAAVPSKNSTQGPISMKTAGSKAFQ